MKKGKLVGVIVVVIIIMSIVIGVGYFYLRVDHMRALATKTGEGTLGIVSNVIEIRIQDVLEDLEYITSRIKEEKNKKENSAEVFVFLKRFLEMRGHYDACISIIIVEELSHDIASFLIKKRFY